MQFHSQNRNLDVHVFDGQFLGQPATFKMTSVIGHVLSIDFPKEYQSWEKTDPVTLFDAPTVKNEANPKARVAKHLQTESKGMDALVLWLDCDREGENICFEVIDNTSRYLSSPVPGVLKKQRIFRAKFSALSAQEIRGAMKKLGEPNKNESLAVDARQELDLKVGVAFTRYQSRFFQSKYGNLDSNVISYGPCQTPTLGFCVERHQAIQTFQPELFWTIHATVALSGQPVSVEWSRGRIFDEKVCDYFKRTLLEHNHFKVVDVVEKEERKTAPPGLNTVALLKAASSSLGMGPAHAMQVAERLYTSGFLSYPRTESSAYPPNFNFKEILVGQVNNSIWGEYASSIMQGSIRSKGGVDAGDHPPITPVRGASEEMLGGDSWRLYEFVCRSFLGSLSKDAISKSTKITLKAGQETFTVHGSSVVHPGFTAIMPWKAVQPKILPRVNKNDLAPVKEISMDTGKTGPPDYLTESELIGLMEENGIGTDASIPVHINNICERGYVTIESGRRVVPTELGITLVRGYQTIDAELCKPQVRAYVEKQINLIAKGASEKDAVVQHCLDQFRQKFLYFVDHIAKMDSLFEASFSPLSSSGKVLSKCGKCNRYMRLIPSRPSRLYCATCEEVYAMPQGGSIKLYKELTCPLDDFQLVMFCLSGIDGKNTIICPYCYNNPPFEDAIKTGDKANGGMPCATCHHPTCRHSPARQGVTTCPQCQEGTLVLDPISAPIWRIDCPLCDFLMYLPKSLHKAKIVRDEHCESCKSSLLQLDWKKGSSEADALPSKACIICDQSISSLCEVKHAKSFVKRRTGGRGRGKRGRGRGRGRHNKIDPLLSFHAF